MASSSRARRRRDSPAAPRRPPSPAGRPLTLGFPHGPIGTLKQGQGVISGLQQGNPDAGGRVDQDFVDAQGLLDGDQQQTAKGFGHGPVFATQHDHEFVAAHARQQMAAGRQHHANASGHPGNHLIPGRVAEGRIDLAESIKIDPQGGGAALLSAAASMRWAACRQLRRSRKPVMGSMTACLSGMIWVSRNE
jgi:hypothetical protein